MTEAQRIGNRRRQADYAWKQKQLLKQVTAAPWAEEKLREIRDTPALQPPIWILLDVEEARYLTEGDVPESVALQCEAALKPRGR